MQLSLQKDIYMPDYETEKGTYILFNILIAKCSEFLTTFVDPALEAGGIHGKLKYMHEMVINLKIIVYSKK